MAHWFAHNRKATDFALTVHDFFVCQNCSELFAPPNRLLADVSETFGVAPGAAFGFEFRIIGRADLPVGLDAQQRVPTWFMAPMRAQLGGGGSP